MLATLNPKKNDLYNFTPALVLIVPLNLLSLQILTKPIVFDE